jgi:CBS domain-containing protein
MIEAIDSCCRIYHGAGEYKVIHPQCNHRRELVPTVRPSIAENVPVVEIMTQDVVCARRDLAVSVLVPLFLRNHIGCIPVVDERGRPIGMITKLDLVERLDTSDSDPARTAEDIMMPLAMTLNECATVAHAAAMMATEEVHHVPVVSPAGIVMGIVSTLDVVRWLARNDGLVARTNGYSPTAGWQEPTD